MSSPIDDNLPPHEVARVATLMLQFLALQQELGQLGTVTEMEMSVSGTAPKEQLMALRSQRQHLESGRDTYNKMIAVLDEVLHVLEQYF